MRPLSNQRVRRFRHQYRCRLLPSRPKQRPCAQRRRTHSGSGHCRHRRHRSQRFVPSWSHTTQTISYEELVSAVHANLDGLSAEGASAGKTIVIPLCYGGEFGPDLEHVAQFHSITPMKWCACTPSPHTLIAMLGFLPGFAYLSGLNPDLETPRLEVPRVRIEAGAVGIGGANGHLPLPSPGGWQIIGRSPLRPYDAEREPAFCMPRAIPLNSRPFPR